MRIVAPPPIVAFHGSDKVALQEALDQELAGWHTGSPTNKEVIRLSETTKGSGKEGDGGEVIHACYAQSLFAERRSILVYDMELFPPSGLRELFSWIDSPTPETALFLIFGEWNSRSGLCKELTQRKLVKKFEAPNPFRIPQWIQEHAEEYNFSIPLPVATQMVEILGTDVERIRLELRKLRLYFAPQIAKKSPYPLTVPLVEGLLVEQNEGMAYKMHEAFFLRDAKAVNIFRQMLERGAERLMINSGFYNAVAHLLAASLVKKNSGSLEEQAAAMGVPAERFASRSRWIGGRTIEELERILVRCEEIEADLKNGRLRDNSDYALAMLPILTHRATSRRKTR